MEDLYALAFSSLSCCPLTLSGLLAGFYPAKRPRFLPRTSELHSLDHDYPHRWLALSLGTWER